MAGVCGVCGCKMGMMTGKVKFLDGAVCTKCYKAAGYSTFNAGEMASMGTISIARWKRMKDPKATEPEEIRVKCDVCGHIFCYTEDDIAMNKFYVNSAKSSINRGALNSFAGSALVGQSEFTSAERDLAKVKDFNRCPKCNSTQIRKLSKAEFEREKATAAHAGVATLSVTDELKKFKELLDMGAISQEEFDVKKRQLLGL